MTEVIIRRATRNDIPRMTEVFCSAYGFREDFNSVVTSFDVSLEVQPDGCFIALLSGRAVGTACYFVYGGLAWVGAVGVVPELQRKGIGTRLMDAVLSELSEAGVRTVRLDASRAGYRLYRRLGFTDEYRTITYDLSGAVLPAEAGDVEVLHTVPEHVAELDRVAFGADRLRVIMAWVRRSAKILAVEGRGYCMLWGSKLGPLIARDYDAAVRLLARALELGATSVIVPDANTLAMKLVDEFGGRPVNTCVRMRLGPEHVEDVGKIFGILNYAKG